MKVLYIEDNQDAVPHIQRVVEHLNYEFLLAETVAEGLAMLQQVPDLVLVDMILPDGDAIEFTRRARMVSTTVPIVVITGIVEDGEREICLAAGANEYYVKPMEIDALIALFKRYAASALK